jgi:D-alanyl-D-alanine carboxypeptidase
MIGHPRSRFITALAAAAVVGCAPAAPPVTGPPLADPLVPRLDAVVRDFLAAEPSIPGAQVAVWRHGRPVLSRGYGKAEHTEGRAVDASTVFRIASLTKQITAAAVVRLAEEGRLSFDDPLSRWVPEYPTGAHVVTLRHLLTHTSGIHDHGEPWTEQPEAALSREEILAFTRGRPLIFAPGERHQYENLGYLLLGMVIERAAGRSYAEYVREAIAAPLGLASISECPDTPAPGHAHGYRMMDEGLAPVGGVSMTQHFSAGGLCATAEDLTRWSSLLFTGGLVSESSLREMTTPPAVRSGTTRYGFGIGVGEVAGVERVSHTGLIAGFASVLTYFPADDLAIAVLFNTESSPPSRLATLLARAALDVEFPLVEDLPTPPEILARYDGVYDLGPLRLRVFARDGRLWLQATGQPPNRLLFQGDDEFRLAFDPAVRVVFRLDDGRAASLVLHQGGAALDAPRVD